MLQYLPIIITALLGLLGLISKTKKDDKPGYFNKLTPYGIVVCLLLFSSFIIAIWIQNDKVRENEANAKIDSIKRKTAIDKLEQQKATDLARFRRTELYLQRENKLILQHKFADSTQFNVTLKNFGEQLKRQKETLDNIQKIIHAFKNVKLAYGFEISEGKSVNFKKYLEKLKSEIVDLIPTLMTSYTDFDGVSVVGLKDENTPNRFRIKKKSFLYPKNSGDEEGIYLLFEAEPSLYIYKKPLNIKQTQFYLASFDSDEEMEEAKIVMRNLQNAHLAIMEYPDISKKVDSSDVQDDDLIYNMDENTITKYSSRTLSPNGNPTGRISSIPDLAKAKVFIRFSPIDPLIKISPQYFQLHLDDLPMTLYDVKTYRHTSNIYFEYSLENEIKEIMSHLQKR